MHFVLPTPSLQHLAGVKIVALLWTQRDIFDSISHSFDSIHVALRENAPELLTMLISTVESKFRALELPERCKRQLLGFIKPLGNELIRYLQYYNGESDSKLFWLFIFQHVCWTMHGTVDYKRAAELLVKDESGMDERGRFELSCINCLEDEARELFQRIAENERQEYVDIWSYDRRDDLSLLILFFTRSINLDVRHEITGLVEESYNNKRLFVATLCSGNRAMCEFVFQRLNRGEKEQVFEECQQLIASCSQSPTRNLLYYLSMMNEEQQGRLFPDCMIRLLECLLHWPMQSLFMETAKRGWELMTNRQCSTVLFTITRKMSEGFNGYDYSQLFWECWRMNSAEYKQFYLNEFFNLVGLLDTQREEFLQLILNEGAVRQVLELCNRHYELSDVLIDESVISDAALMECKDKVELYSANDPQDEEKRLRSEQVSRLIDNVIESRMERREHKEDSSSILRNLQQMFHKMSVELS